MTNEYVELSEIKVSVQQVKNCAFSQWYSKFAGHTPQAKVIKPVPGGFLEYLEQDGIKLPNDSQFGKSSYYAEIGNNEDNEYSDWEASSDEEHPQGQDVVQLFPELHKELKDIFREMGSLTPKLTWSSPKDATWILANNTLKCTEVNDMYLLLKASNYITHDLDRALAECFDKNSALEQDGPLQHELVLRKWFDLNPALEFRVFVKDSAIIGVSQRDLNYYDYLELLTETFKDLLDEFVEDIVLPRFPDSSFVCDVYIPRPFEKVWLIDFNPFARKTDSLLFSWNELATIDPYKLESDYELRLVQENNVARFASKEHSENQVPKEVADAITNPKAIQELAEKWGELLNMQKAGDSSDDEPGEQNNSL
ncbi:cell proliferation protein CDC123 [Lachancea thermotolerans CBS 6340]|uniref:Translation initiation factor eIF2 assembly protein n=1 Tax=Lachancea thermotolerans (strain ATCC 56472 / CBS 6340 / NRRL Y-8284) TaxID=559295 RepID=C5E241_LACTC|nr:KLTH0H01958p [Lachancea thermotolerans CBS 6340]CAR30102.1 KLTH0H01958p [Lachancea thermotolerans CBS 6340]